MNFIKELIAFIKHAISDLKNPYERCYDNMERSGYGVFGMCSGQVGGTSATEYLSEFCIGCPHLTLTQMNRPKSKPIIIAVDFDGTLCANDYPNIGNPNLNLISKLKQRQENGDRLILWTCRVDDKLEDAISWCYQHGLKFNEVNKNLPDIIEFYGTDTRKIFANVYLDDRNVTMEEFR